MASIPVTFYEMVHSPFCIPIARVFEACGVPFKRVEVPNWDRSSVLELTGGAYYQVPVLANGDAVVYESAPGSQDVARYVDQVYAGGRLFPDSLEGLQAILIDHIENDIEAVTFKLVDPAYIRDLDDPVKAGLVRRHKERKFGPGCVEEWAANRDALQAEAERLLSRFDQMLMSRDGAPFLLSSQPVYTDFLLYGILGNYLFRDYNVFPVALPRLAAWYNRLREFSFA